MSFLLLLSMFLAVDAGVPRVTPDDREVVKHLELLELMEETSELELLQELTEQR